MMDIPYLRQRNESKGGVGKGVGKGVGVTNITVGRKVGKGVGVLGKGCGSLFLSSRNSRLFLLVFHLLIFALVVHNQILSVYRQEYKTTNEDELRSLHSSVESFPRMDHQQQKVKVNLRSVVEDGNDDEENKTKNTNSPELAWLMSYPNSGTSYTIQYVMSKSNTTVGTNYEKELEYDKSIPLFKSSEIGPFILLKDMNLPPKYILTKTHCDGYSDSLSLDRYMINSYQFQLGCATTISSNSEKKLYAPSVNVKKIIRLVRNPFDNVVSNYNLWSKKHSTDNEKGRDGFKEYCKKFDDGFYIESLKQQGSKNEYVKKMVAQVKDHLNGVPCHQQFIRYVNVSDECVFIFNDIRLFAL